MYNLLQGLNGRGRHTGLQKHPNSPYVLHMEGKLSVYSVHSHVFIVICFGCGKETTCALYGVIYIS